MDNCKRGDMLMKKTPLMVYIRDKDGEPIRHIDKGEVILVLSELIVTSNGRFNRILVSGTSGWASYMSLSDRDWFKRVLDA